MAKKRWGTKRGRKARQNVARYPSGQIVHAARQQAEDPRAVVLACRKRRYGDEADADPRWGYELGRLWLAGLIDRRQHDAGLAFASAYVWYHRARGYPCRMPQSLLLSRVKGCPSEDPPSDPLERQRWEDNLRNSANRYLPAVTDLAACGAYAKTAVEHVCLDDSDTTHWPAHMMQGLKAGLNQLAWSYQIGA